MRHRAVTTLISLVLACTVAIFGLVLTNRDHAETGRSTDETLATSTSTMSNVEGEVALPQLDGTSTEAGTAALIEQATTATSSEVEQVERAVAAATNDGEITTEEESTIVVEVEDLDQAIGSAVALLDHYSETYADAAEATIGELERVEGELAAVAEANAALARELDAPSTNGNELEAAARQASTTAGRLVAQTESWLASARAARDG